MAWHLRFNTQFAVASRPEIDIKASGQFKFGVAQDRAQRPLELLIIVDVTNHCDMNDTMCTQGFCNSMIYRVIIDAEKRPLTTDSC